MLVGYSHSLVACDAAQVQVDEYIYQDTWQEPSSAWDRALLLLGDPLEQVQLPFTPTSLIQNYVVYPPTSRQPAAASV